MKGRRSKRSKFMDELLYMLAHSDLCRQMESQDLDVLKSYVSSVQAPANTILYSQNDEADAIYIIAAGRVELTRRTEEGRLEVLALLRNGDLFGEAALLDVHLRDHSAMSLDDTALHCLEAWAFKRMALEHPQVAAKVLGSLSERVKSSFFDRRDGPSATTHPIVSFFSAKGGVGKSFLAASAAVLAASRLHLRVCLVELDLQFGNLDAHLCVHPRKNLWDIIANEDLDTVRPQLLRNYGLNIQDRLLAFFRPKEVVAAERLQGQHVVALLHRLQSLADLIIVDCRAGLDEIALTALDVSDHVFVVTTADFAGVAATSSLMNVLRSLHYASSKVHLLVNLSAKGRDLPETDLAPLFEGMAMNRLPFEPRVIEATNRNEVWAKHNENHPIAQKLTNLMRAFSPTTPVSPTEAKKGSLLRKWLHWLGPKATGKTESTRDRSFLPPSSDHDRRGAISELAMGQGYYLVGRYDASARALEKAIELDPRLSLAYYYLGEIARFDGNAEEALLFYEAAVKHNPESLRFRIKVALESKAPAKVGSELSAAKKAIEEHPRFADLRLQLALLHAHRKEHGEALKQLDTALKINGEYVEAWTLRGKIFRRMQQRREALQTLLEALKRTSSHVPALFELGQLFHETRLHALAKRALSAVLDVYPGHLPSHQMLLELQEPLAVIEREILRYQEAIDLHPDFGDLRYKLSIAHYQLGDFHGAMLQAREALRCRFNKTRVEELLGQIGRLAPLLDGTFLLPAHPEAQTALMASTTRAEEAPEGEINETSAGRPRAE